MAKQTETTENTKKSRSSINTDSPPEGASLFSWVGDLAERVGVDRVGAYLGVDKVGDLLSSDRVGNALGEAIQGAARTKARLDKNMQLLLTVANLPSKRDYDKLQIKLDALQAGLMTVSAKLDRVVEELESSGAGSSRGLISSAGETASTLSERARSAIARSAAAAAGRSSGSKDAVTGKAGAAKKPTARTRKSAAPSAGARKTTRR